MCTSKFDSSIWRNMRMRVESLCVSARAELKTTVRTISTKRCVWKRRKSSACTYCEMSCGSRSKSMLLLYSQPRPYAAVTGQLGRRPWNE